MESKDSYFEVLCKLAGLETPIEKSSFYELMRELYDIEFYWSVPNDDNRALDGIELRKKYKYHYDINTRILQDEPCSLLEMLLALAKRCDDDIMYSPIEGDRSIDWFWMMLTNLGVNKFRDSCYGDAWVDNDVIGIMDKFMDREYNTDGKGGLFPLKHPSENQLEVEIWYQMNAYLLENTEMD